MSAPFIAESMTAASLAVAVVLGAGFGFALERSGLGNALKLIGQFYGRDFAVMKVMFSALLVATLGVFWLSRFGLLDLRAVYVPQTFLWPQLAGGLLFGAGLVLAGLCPGTACVAAATGRVDALFVLLGIFAGMIGVGSSLAGLEGFYRSGAHGAWTLPELTGLSYGIVVAVVVAVALVAFAAAEWIERRVR